MRGGLAGATLECGLVVFLEAALAASLIKPRHFAKSGKAAAEGAKFRSRCLKINPVIKLAASAASPMNKMQESPHPLCSHAEPLSVGSPAFWSSGRLH